MSVTARRTVGAAATAAAMLLVAACGGGSSEADGKTTITVGLFGTFGYEEAGLFDEYMALHPDIVIKASSTEKEESYWPALQTKLAAGGGLSDVQGFEVGRSVEVTQGSPDLWTDLSQYGAADLEENFYDFKWAGGVTSDGKILGLGTDIGPLAMCYRTDLFAEAGLPTDREEVAAAWSTWEDYLALGEKYEAASGDDAKWIDSAGSVYSSALGQNTESYYDSAGNLIYENSPAVQTAWDLAMTAVEKDLTAKLSQYTTEWNQAFSTGSFATIACPAWMLGYIKGQAGDDAAGTWDVATMPGGGGNNGGSYLGVPAKAEHPAEAAALVEWLTAPEQQIKLFVKQGSFPSSPQAAEDPQVADNVNAYFSDAPVGTIFAESAATLGPQVHGLKDRVIGEAIGSTGIGQAEQQGKSSEEAWAAAMEAAKKAIG